MEIIKIIIEYFIFILLIIWLLNIEEKISKAGDRMYFYFWKEYGNNED